MKYYVYKTTNLINEKYYIGVHRTNDFNDDYYGSGKLIVRAINKYGIENFKKEILFETEIKSIAYEKEKLFVNVDDPNSYNLHKGGHGGFEYIHRNGLNVGCNKPKTGKQLLTGINRTEEQINRDKSHSKWMKENFFDEERKQKLRENQKTILCNPKIRKKAADSITKDWLIITPDGSEQNIRNLKRFCQENNLHYGAMSRVASGSLNHYKKWKCKKINNHKQ